MNFRMGLMICIDIIIVVIIRITILMSVRV